MSPRSQFRRSAPLVVLVGFVAFGVGASSLAACSSPPGGATASFSSAAGPSASAAPRVVASASVDTDGEDFKVASDSPRAAVTTLLALTRAGRYQEASRFLELPRGDGDAARVAMQIDAVLRRWLIVDVEELSPLSLGNPNDGLPAGVDELGHIAPPGASAEAVRLVRRTNPDGTVGWMLSRSTVERLDKLYDRLGDRWLRAHLPERLFLPGPKDVLVWQWLAFPLIALLAYLTGVVVTRIVRPLLDRFLPKTDAANLAAYRERIKGPFRAGFAIAICAIAVPLLVLDRAADAFVWGALRTSFHLTLFWALIRIIEVATRTALTSAWGRAHPAGAGLMPLVGKLARIALIAIGAVTILSELGYPVASIVAGLGIGGLALALAAQKTVENLFGGVSIGADQPFRIGDYVTIDGAVTGTVEALGLRSTRVRTLDRTLVTIPNGKLAEMRIENFSARDRFRFNTILPLAVNTAPDVLAELVGQIDAHIRAMGAVWPDAIDVAVKAFTKDALELEVSAAFVVKDAAAFRPVRLELLLKLAGIVRDAGASFAEPPREKPGRALDG